MIESLSKRGAIAHESVLRTDFEVFFQAMQNRYHPETNPKGAFTLNVAENILCWDRLKYEMSVKQGWTETPDWVAGYTSCLGHPEVREAFASFLSKFITDCPIDSDHIALSAGATSVIEVTSWILAEEGDVAVFPAPCYPVYKNDIGNKAGVERYDLITHHHLDELKSGPTLSLAHLVKAKVDIESQGKTFRMLVLTSPDNPSGMMYPADLIREIAKWCINEKIHLIVNEIYGLSKVDTLRAEIQNDYPESIQFEPFGKLMDQLKSEYLHLWYAVSKDFGASGFRVGLLHTHNLALLKAYDNFNAPHMVSNHTQWLFQMLLSDHAFVHSYIEQNQKAITDSYLVVVQSMKQLGVPYVPSRGSLFAWVDLSKYLKEQTLEAENQLWLKIYNETGVLFTPGEGFGHSKFGLFRVVYTCVTKAELEVAMGRVVTYLKDLND